MSAGRGGAAVPVAPLFSPLTFAALFYTPLLLAFTLTPEAAFLGLFDSLKYYSTSALLYYTACIALFATGAFIALRRGTPGRSVLAVPYSPISLDQRPRWIDPLLVGAMAVSLLAYVLWFGLGLVRAGGPASFFSTYASDPFTVKEVLLRTIPGVTTLVQLSVAAVPLAIVYGSWRRPLVRGLGVAIFAFAFARSFLFSERLALLELLIPAGFLMIVHRRLRPNRLVLLVVGTVLLVLAFYAISEARRSFVYSGDFSIEAASFRALGYYLTSINNGFLVATEYRFWDPFYSMLEIFWRFPGIESVLSYERLFAVEPSFLYTDALSRAGLNPEFFVLTLPGYLAADVGWMGAAVMGLLGALTGRLYLAAATDPLARAFYAVWLVGLLELMRISYFFDTRLAPVYFLFAAVYIRHRLTPERRAARVA